MTQPIELNAQIQFPDQRVTSIPFCVSGSASLCLAALGLTL